ncbi:Helix-turn-helix domain-containing protein [Butyrivibrio hungatei DSM 14810]|uniref:Helix-turn-helix domain-containing protein n=1 Tax=Butyrivibrio hungatei DSM 14810 TaxID=1121132 RepID=A0A1M7S662_9FIRM|nr:helix-turn-helix domain-containing protein [Butyrivibrio hungatei]SHN53903.1 Helix-turn-helix domain-containing protein [Butyrivibrio hungatei DSM 14810]
MKTYSVKQISEMLDTNPETVRRWIRDNKLSAVQISKKTGNVVTEDELHRFINATPKYLPSFTASSLGVATVTGAVGLAALVGGVVASALLGYCDEKNQTEVAVKPDDFKNYLKENIKKFKKKTEQKQALIKKTEKEIEDLNKKIEQYKYLLEHEDILSDTLESVIGEKENIEDE